MNIPEEYRGRFFYHFTHVDNIDSIVENGALLSTNLKKKYGISHHNIANVDIQNRRSEMKVPVGPGGVVHDYVPFYFTSINPMLLGLLNRKVIDQPYICFIAVSIDKIVNDSVIFTDASANTRLLPNFYDSPDDLSRLNWELIDSKKWKDSSDKEKHQRMAEVLVHHKVPLSWIDSYIVFNKIAKQKIEDTYKREELGKPKVSFDWFAGRPFFFTKFFLEERKDETLVTGPIQLERGFRHVVGGINEKLSKCDLSNAKFENIQEALDMLENDFCILPELEGIYELYTENSMHLESVSEHTIKVVEKLPESRFYYLLNDEEKNIVKLSAYLHDIGKGPKTKWENGVQRVYPDHPADAIPMLKRILTEEFREITEKQVKYICLLVIYHDLMGEIIGKGRSIEELCSLQLSRRELYMLAALSEADICSICNSWMDDIFTKLNDLIDKVLR